MTPTGLASRSRVRNSRVINVNGKLALSGKDRGFTIIELLVVMAIIGLLAAIAIPVFSKLKNNAYDSAAQSDLRQIALQAESVNTTTGAYPASAAAAATLLMTPAEVTALNVKPTNATENFYFKKSTDGLSFAAAVGDTRSGNYYCWLSAGGSSTKVANGKACTDLVT